MKTILVTAYAVNPYKGSEDGTGWNFVYQIAKNNMVIAITRKNNRVDIEKYFAKSNDSVLQNIQFEYYDLPYWMRFWKKGARGYKMYFYLWQLFMPVFILSKNVIFDIAHNLNFHSDSHPTFLWLLGKPLVWGPIGHHPPVPKKYIQPIYGTKEYYKDQFNFVIKTLFRALDPFFRVAAFTASKVIGINSSVAKVAGINKNKYTIMSAVANDSVVIDASKKDKFRVLSIGRFVAMKGFDITIKAFIEFYNNLPEKEKNNVELILLGEGEQEDFLKKIARNLVEKRVIKFINWIDKSEVGNIYNSSSIFLFPSHEGAGMVVPEALSYGLPCLTFSNVGPGEMINNTCGRKVDYDTYQDSVVEFASHLHDLYDNSELYNQLSKGAITHFNNEFTWNKKGERLKTIYNEITATKNNMCTSAK